MKITKCSDVTKVDDKKPPRLTIAQVKAREGVYKGFAKSSGTEQIDLRLITIVGSGASLTTLYMSLSGNTVNTLSGNWDYYEFELTDEILCMETRKP